MKYRSINIKIILFLNEQKKIKSWKYLHASTCIATDFEKENAASAYSYKLTLIFMQKWTDQSFAITYVEREHRKQNLTALLFKQMKKCSPLIQLCQKTKSMKDKYDPTLLITQWIIQWLLYPIIWKCVVVKDNT